MNTSFNSIYNIDSNPRILSYLTGIFASTHQCFKDHGDRCSMRCKICGDSKKSLIRARLNYYKSSNSVHCFNCGFDGKAVYYLSKITGSSISEIKSDIFKKFGISKNSQSIPQPKQDISIDNTMHRKILKLWNSLSSNLPQTAIDWIELRKLRLATFRSELFEFKWSETNNYLAFPWIINNAVEYVQLRNINNDNREKYLFLKNIQRPPFFNVDLINKNIPYVVICESAIDSIFIQNCVAGGTLNISNRQTEYLKMCFPGFKIIIMTDNINVDSASMFLIKKLLRKFRDCQFFIFPKEYEEFKDVGAIVKNLTGQQCITAIQKFSNIDFILRNSLSAAALLAKLTLSK